MCVDLHTHSIYSDGTTSPHELVTLAVEHRLQALALTDHDTVEGVAEVQALGQEVGLLVLSGVEISTTWRNHTLHILGYDIDPQAPLLRQWLLPLQQGRSRRNTGILEKLAGLGIEISEEEMQQVSEYGQTGRPHIAQLLMAKGYVATMDAAFRFYLGRHKPAWVPRFSYTAVEAIDMIHQCGGFAVLAHPGQVDPQMRVQAGLIRELKLRGLDGLEVHYPSHTRKTKRKLLQLASQLHLLVTGGSDFHGANRPAIGMAGGKQGFCPPDSILEAILSYRNNS